MSSLPKQTVRRRGAPPELQEAGNQMKEAFNLLKNVISKRTSDKDDDEYDLFGKMLAKKIRKLPEHEREVFMYEIEGMYINKLRNVNSFSTHSNTSSTSTERFDPQFTTILTPTHQRPPSSFSSYSESTCPTYPPNFTHMTSENYSQRIVDNNIINRAFSVIDENNH